MSRKDYALLLMAFAFLFPAIPFAWADEDEQPAPVQPRAPGRGPGQGMTPQAACVALPDGTINDGARTGESQTAVDPVTGLPIARPGR